MDIIGKCIFEYKEENNTYLIVELTTGEIKIFRECDICFIALKLSDRTHNCELWESECEDEGYSIL